jgi:hypothetical protein
MFFYVGLMVLFVGVHVCLNSCSEHDLEQASLLPFADDLEAARNMSQATGRFCDKVIAPVAEHPAAKDFLRA